MTALTQDDGLPARSALFTSSHVRKMVDRGLGSNADVLLLDLEDSVPPATKADARQLVAELSPARPGPDLIVRVNGRESNLLIEDVGAAVRPWLTAILLPKVESRDDIVILDHLLTHFERRQSLPVGRIRIWASIETARGVTRCDTILASSPRISGVLVGVAEGGDIHRDLGSRWSPDGLELLYVRGRVLAEARALRIRDVIEGPFVRHSDDAGLRSEASTARRMGYSGKAAIHPRQVPVINEIFSSPPEEVAYYERVEAAMESAIAQGLGATTVDGNMVDLAMLELARAILRRAHSRPTGPQSGTP